MIKFPNLAKIFSPENERMAFIVVTMFLNFLGFSIIIPILPFLVGRYVGANNVALFVGLIMSSYALCQFFAAPGLGAVSDRIGRRPVLLVSLFGSIIGYVVMAIGGSIWIIFLGRIIDGLTGGNISTVYAYIADITKPQDRGRYYGILGAAGGVGFMLGPAIGGFVAHINLVAPLYLGAFITLLNVIFGYFVLPESLHNDHRVKHIDLSHLNPFMQFNHIFEIKALKRVFSFGFLFFLALISMQAINAVFFKDVFHWNPPQIGLILFVVGVVDIISQGFLVTKLLPIFGDVKVAILGLILTAIGLLIAASNTVLISPVLIYVGVIILITGDGLFEPSFSSLVSNSVDRTMQGRVQGANQGMQSISRVIAPLFAASLYSVWKGLPYLIGAFLIFIAIILVFLSRSLIHEHKKTTESFG